MERLLYILSPPPKKKNKNLSDPQDCVSSAEQPGGGVEHRLVQGEEGCVEERVHDPARHDGHADPQHRHDGRGEEVEDGGDGVDDAERDEAVAVEARNVAGGVAVLGVLDDDGLDVAHGEEGAEDQEVGGGHEGDVGVLPGPLGGLG